jgi:hypothetical protein
MKKENLTTIIALGIVVIILVSGIILVKNASGVNPLSQLSNPTACNTPKISPR